MRRNIALEKSEDFGVRIVELYKYLYKQKAPEPIITQITKSGTSIGANLYEASNAITDKDFQAKVYISLKECSETKFWLRILKRTNYLPENLYNSLYSECEEIYKILAATTRTLRDRFQNKKPKS